MFKKGDLSINVIIVAAIALVVFVVLIAMFTGKTKDFSSGLSSCAAKQGKCEPVKECPSDKVEIPNAVCKPATDKCCISVLNS